MRYAVILATLAASGCGPSAADRAAEYQAAVTALERQKEKTSQAEAEYRHWEGTSYEICKAKFVEQHSGGDIKYSDALYMGSDECLGPALPGDKEKFDRYFATCDEFNKALNAKGSELKKQLNDNRHESRSYKQAIVEQKKLKNAQERVEKLEAQL